MRIDAPTFPTHHTSSSEAFVAELLVEVDASTDATLDIVIPKDKRHFTSYYLFLSGITNDDAAGSSLEMTVSFDDVNFETGTSDYEYAGRYFQNGSAANQISSGDGGIVLSAIGVVLLGSAVNEGYSGVVWSHFLGDSKNFPMWFIQGAFQEDAGLKVAQYCSGHCDQAGRGGVGFGQATTWRFQCVNDNILRGNFRLYGIM